jgi:hypothetical protein
MPFQKLRQAFVYCFTIICVSNIVFFCNQYQQIHAAAEPALQPGHEFADLVPYLTHEHTIGYFTDLDFSAESIDTGSFLSAQYRLAPVVLDVNNTHHRLILIDASSRLNAFNLMEKLHATPVYVSPYGKLLVQRQ